MRQSFPPLILQGIAAGIGTSNFLRVFLNSFFELLIRWINEANPARSSSVFKLWFLDSLFFFCFSSRCAASDIFFHISGHKAWMFCFFVNRSPGPCVPIWRFFCQGGESCDAYDLRAPHRLTRPFQVYPGATTFPPVCALLVLTAP